MLADLSYDEKVFTEQAKYIDSSDLENWHIEHPNEKLIMKKLRKCGISYSIKKRNMHELKVS